MSKLYVYAILVIVVLGFVKWGHTQVWEQGYNAHKSEISDSKDKQEEKEKKQVDTLIGKKAELKKKFKSKEKKIDKAKDKTGCADVKLTDMGFGLQ